MRLELISLDLNGEHDIMVFSAASHDVLIIHGLEILNVVMATSCSDPCHRIVYHNVLLAVVVVVLVIIVLVLVPIVVV